MNNLEQRLDELFLKTMPGLSAGVKETAAKVLPWLMMIFGGLGLLAWLSSLRFFFGFAGLVRSVVPVYAFSDAFMMIYLIAAPIAEVMAVYGGYLMLSRRRRGWILAFYALLIGLISQLCSFSIVGIVLNVVFAYLLFQIKEFYSVET